MKSKLGFDDIFTIGDDGLAWPKGPRESTIPEIIEIIKRSPIVQGDADGRKKLHAKRELLAIYLIADPRSQVNIRGLKGDEKLAKVIDITGLPRQWVPDKLVLSCIQMYNETITEEVSIKLLDTSISTLATALRVIEKLKIEYEKELSLTNSLVKLTDLTTSFTTLTKLTSSITDEVSRLKDAKSKVSAYESKIKLGRANKVISNSMQCI